MIEGLAGARVYVDANILIYFVEKIAGWHRKARVLFQALTDGECDIVTSEISLGECLYRPYRDKNAGLIAHYDAFFGGGQIIRADVDVEFIRAAAALAGESRLKLIDAIHVATAIANGCAVFVSNDARIRPIAGLRIFRLGEIEDPHSNG